MPLLAVCTYTPAQQSRRGDWMCAVCGAKTSAAAVGHPYKYPCFLREPPHGVCSMICGQTEACVCGTCKSSFVCVSILGAQVGTELVDSSPQRLHFTFIHELWCNNSCGGASLPPRLIGQSPYHECPLYRKVLKATATRHTAPPCTPLLLFFKAYSFSLLDKHS